MNSTEQFMVCVIDTTTNKAVDERIVTSRAAIDGVAEALRATYPNTVQHVIFWSFVQVMQG